MNERLQLFLESHGIQVASMQSLNAKVLQDASHQKIVQPARDTDRSDVEAVFISCPAMRTALYLEELEARLQKPVLTANLVSVWDAVRLAGVSPAKPYRGRLFEPGAIAA